MATGQAIINLGVCGNNNLVGFNTQRGCGYEFQNTIELWRTPADFEFDLTQNFDADYIKSLQLAGNLSILKGIADFPENGTDPLIETLPDNTEISAGDAKYKFSPVFAKGGANDMYFNKLLGYLEGQGNNRFCFVDSAGNILLTAGTDSTKARGMITSRTHRAKFTAQSSGVGQKASLDFQLAETFEYEDNWVMIFNENLNFDPRVIEPIIQSELAFNATPADGDDEVVFDLKLARGLKEVVTGATNTADWEVKINGTVDPIVSITESPNGTYQVIFTNAVSVGDIVSVRLNDVVEITGDGLYRSFPASITTVA